MNLTNYGQYKEDIFTKLDFHFEAGKKILDVGCGDGVDSVILRDEFKLDVVSLDIYEHENIKKFSLNFVKGSILSLPFKSESFDYVFLHDVLHHIDEPKQRVEKHLQGLQELRRITKKGGFVIIIEGNRFNPLFYPHMVRMLGHDHFRQSYFKKIVNNIFQNDSIHFKFFEAHLYPGGKFFIWKLYELLMDNLCPSWFRAYNVAVIKVNKA